MKAKLIESRAQPGRWVVEGNLDFDTAKDLREQIIAAMRHVQQSVVLDLSQVERANSVGLSLLLVAARALKERSVELKVEGMPAGLRSMAEVYGLDEWLDA
ncbi:lipid asymmetry maintenance protein MlaB [Halopseudomonas phragmitis]|uniref:STAS domain-containing protein n=2 Tax=Pseudomonadaceae TaxID=135621 RepID=A0A1V0B0M5_9GAMM|nr:MULTISPECIES: STAS domain-containing protein [Pseudomonadaceae]AQZ93430.1 hypothetical protein BVH74_01010 [Halopseudomonas phragmitis]RHW19636.1 anti-sigma factor antagonist [Pseudomonas jilinensis]